MTLHNSGLQGNFTPHMLRYGFVTQLLKKGVDSLTSEELISGFRPLATRA